MTDSLLDGEGTAPQDTTTLDVTNTPDAVINAPAPVDTPAYNFHEHISEDIQSNVAKFKSADDLARSYVNLEKRLGSSISIPAEDAAPDTKRAFLDKIKDLPNIVIKPETEDGLPDFYKKLGRPDTPEGYLTGDIIPSELLANDPDTVEELEKFRKASFDLGLSNAQSQGIMKMKMEMFNEYQADYKQTMEEGLQVLKQSWGEDYDARLNAAKNAKEQLKGKFPDQMDSLLASNSNNPALAYLFSELGFAYQEQGMIGATKVNFGETPDTAKATITKKRNDPIFKEMLMDRSHPEHASAVQEMEQLYKIGYPK